MSKFTPGPWVVNTNVRYAINFQNKHVAMVSSYEMFESDRAENEANARLIAAAPAMYEALQKCAEFASKTGSEPEVLVVIMQQIAKISQAALRAADGGE